MSSAALKAILAQHTWDIKEEDIRSIFDKVDIKMQQDFLQHFEDALIMYFEYDKTVREYKYQLPRYKKWYAFNHSYKNVMFLFKTPQDNIEIVSFDTSVKESRERHEVTSIEAGEPIRTFCSEWFIREVPSYTPVTYEHAMGAIRPQLNARPPIKIEYDGQMFDTNGKCVGLRLRRWMLGKDTLTGEIKEGWGIADLRIPPQYPIIEDLRDDRDDRIGVDNPGHHWRYVVDSKTNIKELAAYITDPRTGAMHLVGFAPYIHQDKRFSLIPRIEDPDVKKVVKYRITETYEQSREWKQHVYIFCRLVLTYWILFQSSLDKEERSPIDDFVEVMIDASEPDRPLQAQPIETMVVLKKFDMNPEQDKVDTYLEQICPNYFYKGKFHVNASEVDKLRAYMKREIELIKNNSPDFFKGFLNSRLNINLIYSPDNEIVGMENVQRIKDTYRIRETLSSEGYYMFVRNFHPSMDPSEKKGTFQQAKLILIQMKERLYFLRLTRMGTAETAQYICDQWKKGRLLSDYEETRQQTTTKRLFSINRRHEIEEEPDNDIRAIEASKEDYYILIYERRKKTTYAAILPVRT
jgi:hypothetical protein